MSCPVLAGSLGLALAGCNDATDPEIQRVIGRIDPRHTVVPVIVAPDEAQGATHEGRHAGLSRGGRQNSRLTVTAPGMTRTGPICLETHFALRWPMSAPRSTSEVQCRSSLTRAMAVRVAAL
jgi:hypothetical protein